MLYQIPKLPYGGITHIANKLGLSVKRVSCWRQKPIPKPYRQRVTDIIADMDTEIIGLKNLPYGGLSSIAEHLNKPYMTVYHWKQYGIPLEHKKTVRQVLKELGYE